MLLGAGSRRLPLPRGLGCASGAAQTPEEDLSWDCCSGDLPFVLIPVTTGLSGYQRACKQKRERGLQVTIDSGADGFVLVGDEHTLLEISL